MYLNCIITNGFISLPHYILYYTHPCCYTAFVSSYHTIVSDTRIQEIKISDFSEVASTLVSTYICARLQSLGQVPIGSKVIQHSPFDQLIKVVAIRYAGIDQLNP